MVMHEVALLKTMQREVTQLNRVIDILSTFTNQLLRRIFELFVARMLYL